MGINICVFDSNFKELPDSEWDPLRHGHDREFNHLLCTTDCVVHESHVNHHFDSNHEFIRPSDPDKLREIIKGLNWEDYSRYDRLLTLCEQGNYIYIEY